MELNDFLMEGAKKSKSKVDIFDFWHLSLTSYIFSFFGVFLSVADENVEVVDIQHAPNQADLKQAM